jgi:serine/threonine protein kinase
MPVSIDDFWKLAAASELLSPDDCARLRDEFAGLKGVSRQANSASLAQWLVSGGRLTRYQASMLAAGKPGPFVFGPFTVTERIESGRLARLFRARYQAAQNVVLVFLAQLTDDVGEHETLIELAQACSAIKNPHVSRTYRAVRHRSQTFIVVEDLAGESLLELLGRGPLDSERACQIGFQAALGLVALHAENLSHGAVCPQHIWMDANGPARLLQFPLVPVGARLKRHEPPLVDYLAPELAEGNEATPLCDVYALGCTLFELLAGRVPFPGGTPQQKLARQRAEFPQRLDQLNPKIPEELADLVAEMMAKDPLLRCQSASHVAHLLAHFVTGAPRAGQPPKLETGGLTPGYGAWKAPDWQAPPQARAAVRRPTETAEVSLQGALDPVVEPADPPAATAREGVLPAIAIDGSQSEPGSADRRAQGVAIVVTGTSGVAAQTTRRRSSNSLYVGIGVGLALVGALIVAALLLQGGAAADKSEALPVQGAATSSATPKENVSKNPEPRVDTAPDDASEPVPSATTGAEDDGTMLWASPTAGPPLDPSYLPNGAQVILALRPAELLNTAEGEKLLDALGPAGASAREHLHNVLGVDPADMDQLTIAFAADAQLAPQAAYVVRLARDIPQETLREAWGQPARARHQGQEFFEGRELAYHQPEMGGGRVVVAAPPAMMKQVLAGQGRPLLQKGIERVLKNSDATRHVSLLFTPSYLLTDGQSLLAGHLAGLRLPIREFLDESIEAVLLSGHVGDELYVEFRGVAPVDRQPLALLDLLRKRWEQVPERLEAHVATLAPQAYGRLVVNRFPRMVQLARDFTRGGVEEEQVVLNACLPPNAAHNLVLGAELTLLESSGTIRPTAETAPAAAARSASDALARRISLSFPRDALDRAMELLAKELGVEIVILGADLQLEGITKNQSLNNVDERDQPAADILRKLLAMANPEGKLVFVVKPNEAGRETIFVTTRAAARKRGDKLPDGF